MRDKKVIIVTAIFTTGSHGFPGFLVASIEGFIEGACPGKRNQYTELERPNDHRREER